MHLRTFAPDYMNGIEIANSVKHGARIASRLKQSPGWRFEATIRTVLSAHGINAAARVAIKLANFDTPPTMDQAIEHIRQLQRSKPIFEYYNPEH